MGKGCVDSSLVFVLVASGKAMYFRFGLRKEWTFKAFTLQAPSEITSTVALVAP